MVQPAQAPASAGPRCSGIQAQGVHNAHQLFPIYTGPQAFLLLLDHVTYPIQSKRIN